jgi:methionine-S-sulfoxide reductase
MNGVKNVLVGYTGGKSAYPTYRNIMDHTEAVRIVYDPSVISFDEILQSFFQQLNGSQFYPSYSCQYRSAIFYHTDKQFEAATAVVDAIATSSGKQVTTSIEPASTFYEAEEYHQKFILKQSSRKY